MERVRKLGPKLLQKVTIEIIEYEDLPLARLHLCQFQPPLDVVKFPDTLFFQRMYSLKVHCDYRQTSIPGVELVSCHPSKQHGTSVSVLASCRRVLIVRVPDSELRRLDTSRICHSRSLLGSYP